VLRLEVIESNETGIRLRVSGNPNDELDQFHLFQLMTLKFGEAVQVEMVCPEDKKPVYENVQSGNISGIVLVFPMKTLKFPIPLTDKERVELAKYEEKKKLSFWKLFIER